jgi:hypothetical protein
MSRLLLPIKSFSPFDDPGVATVNRRAGSWSDPTMPEAAHR